MSIQIKTTEGIVTLSNATDVRETGVLVVRGHKGITLGFIAPLPQGGWVVNESLKDLAAYLATEYGATDRNDLGIQTAVETLIRHYSA